MAFIFNFDADLFTLTETDKEKETFCKACSEVISGEAYNHKGKELLWIHESCTKLPTHITHPLHSFHPLTLLVQIPSYECNAFICNGCGDYSEGFTYNCNRCDFNLDIKCASLLDDSSCKTLENRDKKDYAIDHFGDQHVLKPCNFKKPYEYTCSCCGQIMYDSVYACLDCEFAIHESCTKLSNEIIHPLHPQHPLTLEATTNGFFVCHGCRNLSVGFTYRCSKQCKFKLDVKCGLLMDDFFAIYNRQTIEEQDRKASIIPFNHEHTLELCNVSMSNELVHANCCYCNKIIVDGLAYVCLHCEFSFHESCVKFPSIKHPLHFHSLTLLYKNEQFICKGCRYLSHGFRFNCKICGFNLNLKCGLLMDDYFSTYDRETLEERDNKANIDHFSHEHVLELCNYTEMYEVDCSCCCRRIHGSAYVCFDCQFFIHESCLNQMQQRVSHPFHGHHLQAKNDKSSRVCNACTRDIIGVGLSCQGCRFELHYRCAKTVRRPLKHDCHEHTLVYFGSDEERGSPKCSACHRLCDGPFYKCMHCYFAYYCHLECIPIPSVVEAKWIHDHRVTLVDSLGEHGFEVYYCDVCEEEGNPKHHLYYCEECTLFVAHIDCVIAKLKDDTSLEESRSDKVQEDGAETEQKREAKEFSSLEESRSDKVQEVDAETEQKRDADDLSFEQVAQYMKKEETSKEIPPSAVSNFEIDTEQKSDAAVDQESPDHSELDAEITNLYAEIEALAKKLKGTKRERTRNMLQSMISGFRQKIMMLGLHLDKSK